jgi:hypothetical protein
MHRDASHWLDWIGEREVRARTHTGCIAALRRLAVDDAVLVVEEIPPLVDVAEAARILGGDGRRVVTHAARGAFSAPLATLASGLVRRRDDVEAFARDRSRRKGLRIAR